MDSTGELTANVWRGTTKGTGESLPVPAAAGSGPASPDRPERTTSRRRNLACGTGHVGMMPVPRVFERSRNCGNG